MKPRVFQLGKRWFVQHEFACTEASSWREAFNMALRYA